MALQVNTTVKETTGGTVANSYNIINYDVSTLRIDGIIKGNILTWRTEADSVANKSRLTLQDEENGIVIQLQFQVTPTTVVKEGADCTITDVVAFFEAQAKLSLEDKYGWDVTIVA